jgi:oxygen-independent coproporphyrinogen-3 oxidase
MLAEDKTEIGSYFVATYPPFSVWSQTAVAKDAMPALAAPPTAGVPLGLYVHIPFCRKRCHFCYFRVYTDRNAREVEDYLDVVAGEWELYRTQPAIAGRPVNFVYFGGGTPSFLSTKQLEGLVSRLTALAPWAEAEEVTFECEPGTLTEAKLAVIRRMGVTRLSLGVENFDDRILELNGRAHRSPEVFRAYEYARSLDFPQINIDLIAGMLGETEDNWHECVRKTIELDPDSVTVYQMELPFNTAISDQGHRKVPGTGRELVDQAPLGEGRVRSTRGGRLQRQERLHRSQESDQHPLRLHRPSVAGRRHGRTRCRLVRARQRRARAEPGYLGGVQRRCPPGDDSAEPRLQADQRGADDP